MSLPPQHQDSDQTSKQPAQVRLLCLGMCRTGTSSLLQVLEALGYNPIHMSRVLDDQRQKRQWIEAIEQTFLRPDPNAPYGRAEFDNLFQGYDTALDLPSAIFGTQLIEAYPDAKVILTTRPPEAWLRSMQNTIWKFMALPSYRALRYLEPDYMGTFLRLLDLIFRVHNKNTYVGKEAELAYEAHNERIREAMATAPDRLLEISPPFDLDKLCNFLGKPAPSGPFPHVNSSDDYVAKISQRRNQSIMRVVQRWGPLLVVCMFICLAFYYKLLI